MVSTSLWLTIFKIFPNQNIALQAVDGGKGGGEQILGVFEKRLTDNIEKLNFTKMLTPVNVKRVVEEADGYQPHLIAPEMGYRRLLMECLVLFKARPFWHSA